MFHSIVNMVVVEGSFGLFHLQFPIPMSLVVSGGLVDLIFRSLIRQVVQSWG